MTVITPRDIRWGDTLVTNDTEDAIWTALWDAVLVDDGILATPSIGVEVEWADGTTGIEVWSATDPTVWTVLEAAPGGGRILTAT